MYTITLLGLAAHIVGIEDSFFTLINDSPSASSSQLAILADLGMEVQLNVAHTVDIIVIQENTSVEWVRRKSLIDGSC